MFFWKMPLKGLLCLLLVSAPAWATSTALFWTYCTTEVVKPGKGNFEIGNQFIALNKTRRSGVFEATVPRAMLPTDLGFNVGLFKWRNVAVDCGIDYFGGLHDPIFLNAKAGIEENVFFCTSPSFSVSVIGVGLSPRTAFNVWNVVVGKTLRTEGTLYAGAYLGSHKIGKNPAGWMVGYDYPFYQKKSCKGVDFYRWHFVADYASGRNVVGGGGFGLAYYVSPDVYLTTGPTWFNSAEIYGSWKWALYLNIEFPVWRKCLCRGW